MRLQGKAMEKIAEKIEQESRESREGMHEKNQVTDYKQEYRE